MRIWSNIKPTFSILNPESAFKFIIKYYITINNTHLRQTNIAHPECESMKVGFNEGIKLEFHGAKVTSDGGLLAYRNFDDALGLFDSVSIDFRDNRMVRNIQHGIPTLLLHSVYSHLAGYEYVYDAQHLSIDHFMRAINEKKEKNKHIASANTILRFETEILTKEENLTSLSDINGRWIYKAMDKTPFQRIILDMDSLESPVYGKQEGSAYNDHF